MKNYLKFIVAVMGVTIATFGSIDANAYGDFYGNQSFSGTTDGSGTFNGGFDSGNVHCDGNVNFICGYTPNCDKIYGNVIN